MRILLDNCVPKRPMVGLLKGHEAVLSAKADVAHSHNGRLLAAAAAGGFDLLLTVDRNMRHQQNIPQLPIPLRERILVAVDEAAEGGLTLLHADGCISRTSDG